MFIKATFWCNLGVNYINKGVIKETMYYYVSIHTQPFSSNNLLPKFLPIN